MKKTALLIILFSLQTLHSVACCAEKQYRLFPVGEINHELILIEFDLFRHCNGSSGSGQPNEHWLQGTVNLVKYQGDSLSIHEIVDSFNFKECICKLDDQYQKSAFETIIATYYQKAFRIASKNSGFTEAKTTSIVFNDTLNTKFEETYSDSMYMYILRYKDLLELNLFEMDVISSFPTSVSEVRSYETRQFNITIIRLRNRPLSDFAIDRNNKRYSNIETAFWKEQGQWHGIAKDFLFVEVKD